MRDICGFRYLDHSKTLDLNDIDSTSIPAIITVHMPFQLLRGGLFAFKKSRKVEANAADEKRILTLIQLYTIISDPLNNTIESVPSTEAVLPNNIENLEGFSLMPGDANYAKCPWLRTKKIVCHKSAWIN